MTSPLRIGIAGLNGYGSTYFKTLAAQTDAVITAVCDTNPQALDEAAGRHGVAHRFGDWDALLAAGGTDAVCVVTSHFLHHPMVLTALRAGQHVFCEKPLAITAAHADGLAAIADGVAPVICLNPSHGAKPPGWEPWEIACRDLAFLRREIREIR